ASRLLSSEKTNGTKTATRRVVTNKSLLQFVGSMPENYERYLVPTIFGPWALDLVEVARARPGERVLDIACGTGIVARTAARRVGRGGTGAGLRVRAAVLGVAR